MESFKPELLLPVGNSEMLEAAIHSGADAIYVGVPGFNARGRSHDHELDELKKMVERCHLYGVKVHLAFNVLIFENELPQVVELLKKIIPLGIDAFIVQDIGLISLIRELSPSQVIHGSTQMTISNSDAMECLSDLDISRFVLARENSLEEIKKIKASTSKEIEVFVHGALCVAYSGQCFTSESMGGRSANRGQCAQSCRLEYEMYVDEIKHDLKGRNFIVSPKDLCGIDQIQQLKDLRVDCLKVEGRLKSPEYVAQTGLSYRRAIDGTQTQFQEDKKDLSLTYSRGFFSGWLEGVNHQELVGGKDSSHQGYFIGVIKKINLKTIILETTDKLVAGMGLMFFLEGQKKGAKIFKVHHQTSTQIELSLFEFNLTQLHEKMRVYLNSNPELESNLKDQWTRPQLLKKIPLTLTIELKSEELRLVLTDEKNRLEKTLPFEGEVSESFENWLAAFSQFGNTPFSLKEIIKPTKLPNLKLSLVKQIRREMLDEMVELRKRPHFKIQEFQFHQQKNTSDIPRGLKLNILLRSKDQVEELLNSSLNFSLLEFVILDFEFGKDYEKSLLELKKKNIKVLIATTRILKPSEYYNLNMLKRLNPDGFLIRNLGALHYLKDSGKILWGDFSLNAANSLSVKYLLNKSLEGLNLNLDLNENQLLDVIQHSPAAKLEVNLYSHLPEFHMEHCVFAAFLSQGKSFKDCGKPCEKHQVSIKDSYGNWHYLSADQECRNTMFKAEAQTAVQSYEKLVSSGLGYFRFEALREKGEDLIQKIKWHLDLIEGNKTSVEVYHALGKLASYGVSSGQLKKSDQYHDRKKSNDIMSINF